MCVSVRVCTLTEPTGDEDIVSKINGTLGPVSGTTKVRCETKSHQPPKVPTASLGSNVSIVIALRTLQTAHESRGSGHAAKCPQLLPTGPMPLTHRPGSCYRSWWHTERRGDGLLSSFGLCLWSLWYDTGHLDFLASSGPLSPMELSGLSHRPWQLGPQPQFS